MLKQNSQKINLVVKNSFSTNEELFESKKLLEKEEKTKKSIIIIVTLLLALFAVLFLS